jgi:AcrR family transcriptional regulator
MSTAEPIARDRILRSAYDLFSRRGVRAVGIEEVIERATVAKATLYRHFPSKDDLVLAFLRKREEVWTHSWVEAEARRRGASPEEALLAIFDLFDEWFHRRDFEGCSFVNVLLETANLEHPVGKASAGHLENIRAVLRSLAEDAGLRDPASFALSFHILMKGSIVQAGEGDVDAAKRAQEMARDLIAKYRVQG